MDLATTMGLPIIGLNDGGGARIQEGVAALNAYGASPLTATQATASTSSPGRAASPCHQAAKSMMV